MRLQQVILFTVAATATYILAGLARVLYALKPELLAAMYIGILVTVISCIFALLSRPISYPATKQLAVGLLVGLALDIASSALGGGEEKFDLRRANIEKALMEFQASGCKPARVDVSKMSTRIVDLSTQSANQALIISGTENQGASRFVSEASYENAERNSSRHGLGRLFDLLEKEVYVLEVRPASCIQH